MRRYSNDPRWITVRYPGKCAKCAADIPAGREAFYYPSTRSLHGKDCGCGDTASADFNALAFDEM